MYMCVYNVYVCTCALRIDVERILHNGDKFVDILARWGPYRDQVQFCLKQSKLDEGRGMYIVSFLSVLCYSLLHLYYLRVCPVL